MSAERITAMCCNEKWSGTLKSNQANRGIPKSQKALIPAHVLMPSKAWSQTAEQMLQMDRVFLVSQGSRCKKGSQLRRVAKRKSGLPSHCCGFTPAFKLGTGSSCRLHLRHSHKHLSFVCLVPTSCRAAFAVPFLFF